MGRIVPLQIPPGAVQTGTEYESRNRWRDVNAVRWRGGGPVPIGGWFARTTDVHVGIVRGANGFVDSSGNTWVMFGTSSYAYALDDSGNVTDVTPAGFTTGNEDAASYTGPATTWSWASLNGIPIGCSDADGKLWEWDLNTANNLTQVSNSPTSCLGVHVTAEQFVVALGDGGDPRSIRWSDRSDRTVWTAAATNQAGGYDIPTDGEIRFALNVRGETIIVTTRDVWRMRYVGYPDVYSIEYVGPCTATGKLAGVSSGTMAFWWGEGETFHVYDGGFVRELRCDVWDYLRTTAAKDTFTTERSKVSAWFNEKFNEVWWLFESSGSSSDVDKYVAYSVTGDYWHFGDCGATTIANNPPSGRPIGFHVPASNLVTNGGFSSGSNWTASGGTPDWVIGAGVATCTPTTLAAQLTSDTIATKQGASYIVTLTVTRTAGELEVGTGTVLSSAVTNTDSSTITSAGTYNILYYHTGADDTGTVQLINSDGAFAGTVDDVSVVPATIYYHECGDWIGTAGDWQVGDHYTTNAFPYAKSGPMELAPGERRVHVTRLLPDESTTGDLEITFTTREYPATTETTHGPYTTAAPTSVRLSGRQFTMKVNEKFTNTSTLSDWRSGTHRVEVTPGGRR